MNEYSRSMRKNGYSESILPTNHGECYLCGKETDTAVHEVYFGNPNRQNSKENGCWVYLCPTCHKRVHEDTASGFDHYLKITCQKQFTRSHTVDEFVRIFGRRYDSD